MDSQLALTQTSLDCLQKSFGFRPCSAMDNKVIGVPRKRIPRMVVNADLNLPVFADEKLPVSCQCQSKPTAPTRSLSFIL